MTENSITDPSKLTIGKKLKIPSQESRSARNSAPAPTQPSPGAGEGERSERRNWPTLCPKRSAMIMKTLNITVGVLVAFSVWCAAVMFAIVALHVLVIGGFTVYHLMHS